MVRKNISLPEQAGKKRPLAVLLLVLILCMAALFTAFYDYFSLPPLQTVLSGDSLALPKAAFGKIDIRVNGLPQDGEAMPAGASAVGGITSPLYDGNSLLFEEAGDYKLDIRLGGIIPIGSMRVSVVSPVYVVPGGQAIGILLQTDGVTVVGYSPVINSQGRATYPAKEAGLQPGDFITAINGIPVSDDKQVAALIGEYGKNGQLISITFSREGEERQIRLKAEYCYDSKSWRIGLYVRDS
ncbi:MAG: PDZ domain-containing protein, partial [Clostridiales bacterium]|nr:PDZ domain-containing protein [Clostridiales bacterium]